MIFFHFASKLYTKKCKKYITFTKRYISHISLRFYASLLDLRIVTSRYASLILKSLRVVTSFPVTDCYSIYGLLQFPRVSGRSYALLLDLRIVTSRYVCRPGGRLLHSVTRFTIRYIALRLPPRRARVTLCYSSYGSLHCVTFAAPAGSGYTQLRKLRIVTISKGVGPKTRLVRSARARPLGARPVRAGAPSGDRSGGRAVTDCYNVRGCRAEDAARPVRAGAPSGGRSGGGRGPRRRVSGLAYPPT
jgi:hypothetical protein